MIQELNSVIAQKVIDTVDHGLVYGLGKAVPGQMCVEAAVCYAYGIKHSDNPPCVGSAVRAFKIALNDKNWSSPQARAKGLRAIAVAQLGSNVLDQKEFARNLSKKTIQKMLPKILRIVAGISVLATHQTALLKAADDCETLGTYKSAVTARDLCRKARAARGAATDYAARGAARAAATAADYATATADYADYAATATAADYADYYAADYAAYAADYAADYAAKRATIRDEWLTLGADICLEVLKKMKSPGCEYLYLLDK